MKNKLFYLAFAIIFSLSFASAFLLSDQGTDVREISTGNLTAIANITISIYDSATDGNLIFQQSFENGIINGSWNVMINPDLEYGTIYWKDYEINGEDLDFDGNERLEFQSSVGTINDETFVNFSLINSCPAGSSIRVIYSNGSVLCEDDDSSSGSADLTNYALKNQSETFEGNITTTNTGFFGWLGSLFSRINKIFVQDIEFNGTINGSGEITTSGNITASYFIGDGSYITGISGGDSYDDSWINNTIDSKIQENNESINAYILYVNSTNGVGSESYDDSWINDTIDNKIQTNNQSIVDYIAIQNASLENYIGVANTSLYSILMNGSFFNTEFADTFIGNYSTFLTHITWEQVMNGTLLQSSQWNATNESYYLASNPNQYYNTTSNIGNWTSDKSSYVLLSILNNGSYFNTEFSDTFIGNYSTFLTHITYNDVMNGTLEAYFDTIYQPVGSYLTEETNWNANYSQFLLNNESLTNYIESNNESINAYILYVNSTNGVGSESYDDSWINDTIDNKIQTNNQSIVDYIAIQNASLENYIGVANTSLYSILMNGSFFNTEFADTFIGNYSTFLTHITWEQVMNGTLLQSSQWNATNESYATWLALNNGTYANVPETDSLAYNGTLVSIGILNNGSYLNEPYTDTFIGNYSTFLTHMPYSAWNATNTSYLENTGDTATGNYSFDSDTLFIDSVNNRVGIGSSMPNVSLDVVGRIVASSLIYSGGSYFGEANIYGFGNYALQAAGNLTLHTNAQSIIFNTNADNERMRLSGLNLGIGTPNPLQRLHVNGSILANGTINATTDICIQGGVCLSTLAASGEPLWTGNYTAFNDSWSSTYNSTYNTWAYNQTIPANVYTDSIISTPNLHTHDASNITSPIWVNKTGDTMSGELNMDSNNITAVDCITFASGGKICSG